jgi:phosphoribosyl-ATP pyrophosphohydrolase/phosphoribosyl-AMP cyclohydrolase
VFNKAFQGNVEAFMTSVQDLKWGERGLIPAVVQDAKTGEVLTVAYVSRESLAKTRDIGETVFFSRSRNELWHKGETSGNTQKVASLMADCDKDAVVIRVLPQGPACHTGARACFFVAVDGFACDEGGSIGIVLGELERVIASRRSRDPEESYTARLLDKGLPRILQKVGEESAEVIVAAMSGDRRETTREASDLLYHLMVALQAMGISLDEVAAELRTRRR